VSVPADAKPGDQVRIAADARWLVCEKICVPEEGRLSVTMPVQAAPPRGNAPVDGRWADAFDQARAALPKPSPWTAQFSLSDKALTLRLDGAALDPARIASAEFFPVEAGVLVAAAPQRLMRDGRNTLLVTEAASRAAKFARLDGVLVIKERLDRGTATHVFAIAAPRGAGPAPAAARSAARSAADRSTAETGITLGWAVLLALAGGIILNLMPCVFPILSMKALSFAAHGGGRMGRHGLAYTAGVLVLFGAIGAALIALKGAGAEVGWGFQLQEPIFVMLMAYLMFAIGLNLSGLFEFGTRFMGVGSGLAQQQGAAGAFFTGALAAVVATPCTAPFMAAAIGYAVTQPAPYAMAVMLALGFGMALPFLVLSHMPALLRRLPRPGPWMVRFRQLLAFPMYATAAWLAWVLSLQAGDGALLAALAGAVLIAFGLWLWQSTRHTRVAARRLAAAVAVLALAGAGTLVAWADHGDARPQAAAGGSRWAAFDPARLASLRREGVPVFVDYTAAWCVTCLVNEKLVLREDAVWAAFRRKGVVTMKADWTRRDPAITRALAELGRNGVPAYALYAPGAGTAVLLPQILTKSTVLAQLALLPDRPSPQRAGQ
jgi:thiol:disulfide interchange protein DsbD